MANIHSFESLAAVDGEGIRFDVFFSGCPLRCAYCHNPDTWHHKGEIEMSAQELFNKVKRYKPYFKNGGGVTFSGGEPFCQAQPLYVLGKQFKERGLNLMCYSGWTFEQLLEKAKSEEFVGKLLSITDILVDGRFVLEKRSLALKFRGSENQRLIDVQESLKQQRVVIANL